MRTRDDRQIDRYPGAICISVVFKTVSLDDLVQEQEYRFVAVAGQTWKRLTRGRNCQEKRMC